MTAIDRPDHNLVTESDIAALERLRAWCAETLPELETWLAHLRAGRQPTAEFRAIVQQYADLARVMTRAASREPKETRGSRR